MGDVVIAFRIAILTYMLGLFSCGLVGIIILIVRKITSKREEGVEQI
jgi:hypothetical protein